MARVLVQINGRPHKPRSEAESQASPRVRAPARDPYRYPERLRFPLEDVRFPLEDGYQRKSPIRALAGQSSGLTGAKDRLVDKL